MATETEVRLTPAQQRILDKVEREVAPLGKENAKLIEQLMASRARRGA